MTDRTTPAAAQFADWWLAGQLLAEPQDLLRDLLAEYRGVKERADTERRRAAELRLRFRRTLREEGWRDEDIEALLLEAERAANPVEAKFS